MNDPIMLTCAACNETFRIATPGYEGGAADYLKDHRENACPVLKVDQDGRRAVVLQCAVETVLELHSISRDELGTEDYIKHVLNVAQWILDKPAFGVLTLPEGVRLDPESEKLFEKVIYQ